jgi:hypothetical protein
VFAAQGAHPVEGFAVLFEKVERIHLMNIGDHLARDSDLFGAEIDALNMTITLFSEKVQKPSPAAGDIDDCSVPVLRHPATQVMPIGLAPDAARGFIESWGEILKVGRISRIDAITVGGRITHIPQS